MIQIWGCELALFWQLFLGHAPPPSTAVRACQRRRLAGVGQDRLPDGRQGRLRRRAWAPLSPIGQGDGRVHPECCSGPLFTEAIVDPPTPLSCLCHQQIQTAPIGELVGLVARNCLSDCQICQHDGTYFVGFDTVNNTVRYRQFQRIRPDAGGRRNRENRLISWTFPDICGCIRKQKWCPEEDSNLHALASAST